MKALTVRQGWADAIIFHGKDIENRNWKPSEDFQYPQRIAIHASKTITKEDYEIYSYFVEELGFNGDVEVFQIPEKHEFVLGAILGTVEIIEVVTNSDSPWFMGDYGFVLRNPKPLKNPIPCKGALGFWEVPKEIELQILEETK